MSYGGSDNTGGSNSGASSAGDTWRNDGGVPGDAFDPVTQPELFRGVATRRVFAFLIDFIVLTVPVILGCLFIAVFGIITLGLGWLLFGLAGPATVVWALVYYGASLGGPHSATIGMRAMDLELHFSDGPSGNVVLDLVQELLLWIRSLVGDSSYFYLLGAIRAVLFYVSMSFPPVLLIGLFNGRRQLLHDILLGTVVINSSARTQTAQPARGY